MQLFHWNLYCLFTFLLKPLLTLHFFLEVSASSSLLHWDLCLVLTFLLYLKSPLLHLHIFSSKLSETFCYHYIARFAINCAHENSNEKLCSAFHAATPCILAETAHSVSNSKFSQLFAQRPTLSDACHAKCTCELSSWLSYAELSICS